MRILLFMLLCGLVTAQPPAQAPDPSPAEPPAAPEAVGQVEDVGTRIGVSVDYVAAPVLAINRDGNYVNNITKQQFHLFDNDTEQNINVDISYAPISLVILVQASSNAQALIPAVTKIGNLIGPQIIGDAGEAAVIAYDHRIRTMQEFTSDPNKVKDAFSKITPGSQSIRLVDAVVEGTRMLRSRPRNRRRIMLVIGETRDMGSENRGREALVGLQMNNVMFYSVDMSRFLNVLTAPKQAPRPDPYLPAMRGPLPGGMASTPTNIQQLYGTNGNRAEFLPLLLEIYRDAKAIFKANPVELFTKGTGGTEFGFSSQRSLESALAEIGEKLHSQYMLSYSPNNRETGGFHEIKVEITGHPEVSKIVTRPGYWIGPSPK